VSNKEIKMGLFKDTAEFQEVFDLLMREILTHPLIGPKLARSNLVVQFQYTEPDAQITINFKEPAKDPKLSGNYTWGETLWQPDVIFKQSADFSNRFWQGKENVIAALAKRHVTARGSITKALALIPVIRPTFRLYPQVLQKLGKTHLVVN
jgi:putative sterol carrier protein